MATLLVLSGIVWGMLLVGQPGIERMKKFDAQRATNLSSLESGINQFAYSKNKLPSTLDELKNDNVSYYYARYINDPETNKPFEYQITSNGPGTAIYELCTNFSLSNLTEDKSANDYRYNYDYNNSKWGKHDKGRVCNKNEAPLKQPQLDNQYPPSPSNIKILPQGQ